MDLLHTLFFTALTLGVLVTFHEFGHFWVARRCGVRVLKFSVGFGRTLVGWKRGETEYVIAAIPLGGYVKMFGENQRDDEEELTPEEQAVSFSHKSVWQRIAIVAAGPIANFILAVFIYWLVFLGGTTGLVPVVGDIEESTPAAYSGLLADMEIISVDGRNVRTWGEIQEALISRIGETGHVAITARTWNTDIAAREYRLPIQGWLADADVPDVLGSLGLEPWQPPFLPIVDEVMEASPAEAAGFQSGDRILSLNDVVTDDWNWWRDQVRASPGEPMTVVVARTSGITQSLTFTPEAVEEGDLIIGQAGLRPLAPEWPQEMIREISYNPWTATSAALQKTWDSTVLIVSSLKKMVTGMISTKGIGGPITIAKVAGSTADFGWQSFLRFLAILSVSLGVLNLLPIPILDGGHLLFYIIELVKGSPVDIRVQALGYRIGMVLLLGIMLLALYNDFTRL